MKCHDKNKVSYKQDAKMTGCLSNILQLIYVHKPNLLSKKTILLKTLKKKVFWAYFVCV